MEEEEKENQAAAEPHGGERQWSDLPHLPLFSIAKRLASPVDFCSFRRTCTPWRSVSEAAEHGFVASQPPWLFSVDYDRLYCIKDRRFCNNKSPSDNHRRNKLAVGFSSGHLILADYTSLHQLFLVHPFTGREVHRFPKAPHAFSRAVLTSPVGSSDSMLIVFNSTSMQYCRTGDVEWGVYQFPADDGVGHVRNVAMFEGRVFALTMDGKLGVIDFTPCPKLKLLKSQSLPFGRFQGTWLGACGKDLLAISCTYQLSPPRAVERFVVRRFDFSSCSWVKVEGLGDRTLFVDLSWGVLWLDGRPSQWGGSGDCIYFSDAMRNSLRVFHMKDGRMEDLLPSVSTSCDHGFRWDLSVWVIPSLCNL